MVDNGTMVDIMSFTNEECLIAYCECSCHVELLLCTRRFTSWGFHFSYDFTRTISVSLNGIYSFWLKNMKNFSAACSSMD